MPNEHKTQLSSDAAGGSDIATAPRCVGDLMTTIVVQILPYKPFRDAVDLLAQHPFRHLLVAEADGRIVGVISDRDVRSAAGCYDSDTTLAMDIMTPEPTTVHADTPISSAIALVRDLNFSSLPVVDADNRVVGIVTTDDLLVAFQNLQQRIEKLPAPSAF
jgi:CBS domain-containing protein